MGRVKRTKEVARPEVTSFGEKSLDALNTNLKSYLKLALREIAKINTGVESSVDAVCNHLADDAIDVWLDVFFDQYKKAIGITVDKSRKENDESEEN